ncbi:hypothetical protein [Dokdonia sp. R86516]|uniref:hypothetical protein n=1 Tax=Dokdonia sp. R86516 TaxID=3093856 RepID=UPI0037C50A22
MTEDENNRYDKGIDEWRKLPVFRQGVVILHLVEHIIEGIKLEDSNPNSQYKKALYQRYTQQMMDNAILIPSAIATAHGVDLYDLKMENATVVRKAAREIIQDSKGLLASGYKDVEYLDLLGDAIEMLRPIFARWVQTFDTAQYIIDRWGLFNPPGINFDDPAQAMSSDFNSFLDNLDEDEDWDDNDEKDSQ